MIAKTAIYAIGDKVSFTIEIDDSEYSLVVTFSQYFRPVSFYSRTLNKGGQNDSAIEKETYTIPKPFKLITDQRSVTFNV